MERWPADERENARPSQRAKVLDDDELWRWPHLDHGVLGRAALVADDDDDDRLKWSTVVDVSHERTITPLVSSTRVFPETRPVELDPRGRRPKNKRVEYGLQFLRTYFPDADFSGDVVLDAITADDDAFDSSELSVGNSLVLQPSSSRSTDQYDVLFPMGNLGRDLNLSSFVPRSSGGYVFQASGVPSLTFETPILQISGPALPPPVPHDGIALVRTHTSASFVTIIHSEDEDDSRSVVKRGDLTRAHTGDSPIVDSRILAMGPDVVAVNRMGHVYRCDVTAGKVADVVEWRGRRSDVPPTSDFWLLGMTGQDDGCFLTSSVCVEYLDFRVGKTAAVVYSLQRPGAAAAVTFWESSSQDHLGCVTTTDDIVWLDDRFHRKPLLSFKHHRDHDRTLRTSTAPLHAGPLTLLTSRRNGLVTVYDVNRGKDDLLHCNAPPSALPWKKPIFSTYTGQAVVVLPCGSELSFFRLTQQGSIFRQDFRITATKAEVLLDEERLTHEWNEDVCELDQRAKDIRPDFGPVAGKQFIQVDLRAAYERLFSLESSTNDDGPGKAFYGLLDQFSTFWQRMEAPVENILTTFDVAVHLGEEPKVPASADFFAGCALNCKRGFRAITQDRLPVHDLVRTAPWCYSMVGPMRCLGYDIPDEWSLLDERLKQLELRTDGDRSVESFRWERKAREQLVVDLALSCDAFSPRPLTKRNFKTKSDEMTAKDTDEPPNVEFDHFLPHCKSTMNSSDASVLRAGQDIMTVSSPLGVRLLLAEWEVGKSVESYTYRDPYNTTEEDQPSVTPRRRQVRPTTQTTVVSQCPPTVVTAATQRPPTIIAANSQPSPSKLRWEETLADREPLAFSQEMDRMPGTYSQTMAPSTQMLPGPFGGRPGGARKMPAKKRIGGF